MLIQYGTTARGGVPLDFPLAYTTEYSVATGGYLEGGTVVSLNYSLTGFTVSYVGWGSISVNNLRWISIGY